MSTSAHTSQRRPPAIMAFELAVILPVASVIAVYAIRSPGEFAHPMLLGWAAAVAVMDLMPIMGAGRLQLSLSFPILLAVALLYPPPVAAAVALIGSFEPRELRRELPLLKAAFIRSEIALSVLSGGALFHAFATVHSSWQILVPSLVGAVAADYAVNVAVVASYTALDLGMPLWDSLRLFHVGKLHEFVLSYAGLALSALVMARLYLGSGPWAVALFFGPLLLARQMFLRTRELEKTTSELRAAEERYRTLVEQIPAVTYIMPVAKASSSDSAFDSGDANTRPYVSPQIERLLGYSPAEWTSSRDFWTTRLHDEDRPRALAENAHSDRSGQAFAHEYRLLARDGRVVWIHEEAVPLHDDADRPAFWHGVMLDITELKEAEGERRRLLDRTVEATEEERRRIAAELHDGPIQHIAAVVFRLESVRGQLERGDVDGLAGAVALTQDELREEVVELRRLVIQLRPPILDQLGLEDALRDHVDTVGRDAGLECEMALGLGDRLDPDLETVVYRVSQEALSNVIKHAQAAHVWVSLEDQNGQVALEVRDDGVGFRPRKAGRIGVDDHIGLIAMRERVEGAGGTWELRSRPGDGTTVRAVFPRRAVPVG